MTHLVLSYTLAADYLERRQEYRGDHLALLQASVDSGDLVLAGALPDPFDRALFVWTESAGDAAKAFVAADPYVANGLVTGWELRTWNTVLGTAMPPA